VTDSELLRSTRRGVESNDGWALEFLAPDVIEYRNERDVCLLNVGYSVERQARAIFVSESRSAFFPRLVEHLRSAAPLLPGRYVLV
jgi:hypothetical protein